MVMMTADDDDAYEKYHDSHIYRGFHILPLMLAYYDRSWVSICPRACIGCGDTEDDQNEDDHDEDDGNARNRNRHARCNLLTSTRGCS